MNVVQKRLNDLEQKLAQAEQAQRLNAETIAEQQREIERLRTTLYRYGSHSGRCPAFQTEERCNCGFSQSIEAL